jgi:hypothetical protein
MYMVSQRAIDPNPENVYAITKIKPPESLHDVQKLTGCMAALIRFISQLGTRGLPFFKLLRKQDKFQWTQVAQEAFKDLKKYLTTPPTLVGPEPMKTCSLTYWLQVMWSVQPLLLKGGSQIPIAWYSTQYTLLAKC